LPDFAEYLLRGAAAGIFLVLAIVLVRDSGGRMVTRLGAFFAVAAASRALFTNPHLFVSAMPWNAPFVLLCFGAAAAFWVFAEALFDDDFRLRFRHVAVYAAMLALGTVIFAGILWRVPVGTPKKIHEASECLLAIMALHAAWRGRSGDLVESRRRVRLLFVSATALLLFVVGTTEFASQPKHLPTFLSDLNVIGLFLVSLGLAASVVGIRHSDMFVPRRAPVEPSDGALLIDCTDPRESRLMTRLEQAMKMERAYRESGLTIGRLAARLDSGEHDLRQLINRRLGWRNFNAYLNGWRLAEARDALVDPSQSEVPISTIALDSGFQSLGPFNRAFKQAEGVTPSLFRQRRAAR
jgi:AraC-like DNA-binding protein